MKPSELKKDKKVSVRVNAEVYEQIRNQGDSLQKIIDEWIDKNLKIEIKEK